MMIFLHVEKMLFEDFYVSNGGAGSIATAFFAGVAQAVAFCISQRELKRKRQSILLLSSAKIKSWDFEYKNFYLLWSSNSTNDLERKENQNHLRCRIL